MLAQKEAAPAQANGLVVLLGDSIFDNKRYVGSGPAVIDQTRQTLPNGWGATLLAVDGDTSTALPRQLQGLPKDTTHIVISVGGNDALMESSILSKPARSSAEVFLNLADIRDRFERNYSDSLTKVLAAGKPTVICTIYDPRLPDRSQQRMSVAALSVFNDCIFRAAVRHALPIIDLRAMFTLPEDFANAIEPSSKGGLKIAKKIQLIVESHDFSRKQAVIY
jgi:GDSL-like Lipase/Acylhydrolase family